jgi:DNA-binding PadR family transcriptional regulator
LLIDIAVLGLLGDQDLHGYELKKRLVETLGMSSGVSFGSLYPALARLERLGAVRSLETTSRSKASIPQTGSLGGELAAYRARMPDHQGRSRKVYRITPEGARLFVELLGSEPTGEDSKLFGLRLAFARHLSPGGRLEMLERRRLRISDQLTLAGARLEAAAGGADRYLQSLLEHDRDTLVRELAWIEGLVSRERAEIPTPAVVERVETGRLATPDPAAMVGGRVPSSASGSVTPPPSLGAVSTERRELLEAAGTQVP